MDDLVRVEVVHAVGDLLGPVDEQRGRQTLVITQDLVELAVRAVLHDDTVAWRLRAHTPVTECGQIVWDIPVNGGNSGGGGGGCGDGGGNDDNDINSRTPVT